MDPVPKDGAATLIDYLDGQIGSPTDPWDTMLTRTVSLLHQAHPHFNWTGIYLVDGSDLVLGPYVGHPTDHVRIPIGAGICGAAAAAGRTIVVDDVHADPRYLACFISTASEIVVPIQDGARVIGEIDVDSDRPAAFGPGDRALLERVAGYLARLAPPASAIDSAVAAAGPAHAAPAAPAHADAAWDARASSR